jgi:broad specificity phosphatase PhoE
MVRHGQASFGKENYDQLSETGQKQCVILAEHMIRTGLSFDAVYTGDMDRQKDTAKAIISSYLAHSRQMPALNIMSEFNEYSSRDIIMAHIQDVAQHDPDLKTDLQRIYEEKKAFQRVFEKIMVRWISGEIDKPGVVRWLDFRERVQGGLQDVMMKNGRKKKVLICTSGGPISAAVQMALSLSDEKTLRIAWHIANASVTTFDYDDQRIELSVFNNCAHLELLGEPGLLTYR